MDSSPRLSRSRRPASRCADRWGAWSVPGILAMTLACSSSVQPLPDTRDGTDELDADDADQMPPDSPEDVGFAEDHADADGTATDGETADADRGEILSCDGPVLDAWGGLSDAGSGCQEVLADPGPGIRFLLPLLMAGGGGYVALVPGETTPPGLIWLIRVDCGAYLEVEPVEGCPTGELTIQYPWLGYTCVWQAEEVPDPPPGTGTWVYAVRLYNIATAERRQFHYIRFTPLVYGVPAMRSIEISWPWIATEDCRNGPGWCGIVLINAETGEERVLSALYDGTDEGPRIDGNYVVFDRFTSGFAWNPWIYDIATGTASSILMDTIDEWDTQVDGGWVIWVDQRNDPEGTAFSPRSPDLYGWEIASRTERPLVVAPGGQVEPILKDGWLFWTDYRNDPVDPSGSWGSTNGDVYARTVPDGPEFHLTAFPDTREWVIDKDGDWVYVYRGNVDLEVNQGQLLRCPVP